jgi:hypothetical protein
MATAPATSTPAPALPVSPPTADKTAKAEKAPEAPGCPSSVAGASTKVKDVKNGVELTVTAKESADQTKIRELARKLRR